MKYALIGCGRISYNHIVAARNNNLDIVSICDIVEENMKDKMLKLELNHEIRMYTSYEKMLDEEDIDIVAICTESGKHAKIALDCINHRKNVIIEKPIALSISDVDAIITRAKEMNVRVGVCHQNRFNKSIQAVREAIDKNRFGEIMYGTANIRWSRDWEYYSRAEWRGTWEQDGGALMNQCIHNIDLLQWMMGDEIEEVFAYTDRLKHDYIDAEDLGIALVKFKGHKYGIIEGTTNIYPTNLEETLCLFGKKGTVKVGGQSVNIIEEWNFSDQLDSGDEIKEKYFEKPQNVYGFGHTPLYKDVIEAIITGREPYVTAEDGKRAMELVLAIYYSAATGKIVKLPLKYGATTDFVGRFDK